MSSSISMTLFAAHRFVLLQERLIHERGLRYFDPAGETLPRRRGEWIREYWRISLTRPPAPGQKL